MPKRNWNYVEDPVALADGGHRQQVPVVRRDRPIEVAGVGGPVGAFVAVPGLALGLVRSVDEQCIAGVQVEPPLNSHWEINLLPKGEPCQLPLR